MDENMREGIEVEETVVETAPVTENTNVVAVVEKPTVGEKVFVGATLGLAAWKAAELVKKGFDFGKAKFHDYKEKRAAAKAQAQTEAGKQPEPTPEQAK